MQSPFPRLVAVSDGFAPSSVAMDTTALLKLRNHNSRLLFETHRLNKHLGSVIGEKSQTQSRQKEVYYGHSPYYTVVAGAGFEPTNVAVKVRCLCHLANPQYNARWYSSNH